MHESIKTPFDTFLIFLIAFTTQGAGDAPAGVYFIFFPHYYSYRDNKEKKKALKVKLLQPRSGDY